VRCPVSWAGRNLASLVEPIPTMHKAPPVIHGWRCGRRFPIELRADLIQQGRVDSVISARGRAGCGGGARGAHRAKCNRA
jgi:hypothetical protein